MSKYENILKLNKKTRLDSFRHKIEKSSPVMKIAIQGLLSAIIFLLTFVFSFIKVQGQGYFDLGDFFIICSSFTLGWSYTIFPAMIGSGLSDLASSSFIYIPATIIIKGVLSLAGIRNKLWVITFFIGEMWMLGMYYLWDMSVVFHGVSQDAYGDLVLNALQAGICYILAVIYTSSIIIWKEKESRS